MNRDELNRSFKKLSPSEEAKKRMLRGIEEHLEKEERPSFNRRYLPLVAAFLLMVGVSALGLSGVFRSASAPEASLDMAVSEERAPAEEEVQVLSAPESSYEVSSVSIEEGVTYALIEGEKVVVEGLELSEGEYLFEVVTIINPLQREDILSLYPIEQGVLGKALIKGQEDLEGRPVDFFLE